MRTANRASALLLGACLAVLACGCNKSSGGHGPGFTLTIHGDYVDVSYWQYADQCSYGTSLPDCLPAGHITGGLTLRVSQTSPTEAMAFPTFENGEESLVPFYELTYVGILQPGVEEWSVEGSSLDGTFLHGSVELGYLPGSRWVYGELSGSTACCLDVQISVVTQ